MSNEPASDRPKCEVCGHPMPPGEEMFKYHGYSGPCPEPPIPKPAPPPYVPMVFHVVANTFEAERDLEELCASIHRSIPNALFIDQCQSLESYRKP